MDLALRWYDWRPYKGLDEKLALMRRGSIVAGEVPQGRRPNMIGVTGTISATQTDEVMRILGFDRDAERYLMPTDRPNLSYAVLNVCHVDGSYRDVLRETVRILKLALLTKQRSMIFVATHSDADFVADLLNKLMVTAFAYHKGLGDQDLKVCLCKKSG